MKFEIQKLFLALSISLVQPGLCMAQNPEQSVFVMVDLSMNIKGDQNPISSEMRKDAIEFTKSLLMATYHKSNFPEWEKTGVFTSPVIGNILNGTGKPLIGTDDFLMIMPFGELKTSENFKINQIRRYPSDFNRYYQFPFTYTDRDTWGTYAEAKVCNIAYNYKIPEYYVVRIQGRPDDPNSQLLSNKEQEMIDEYDTGSKGEVIAKFKHKKTRFSVTVKKIDITKIPGISKYPPIHVPPENIDKKSLRIVAPKGESKKPFESESTKIRVSWICIGCDSTTNYNLTVNNLDTKKTESHKDLKNISYKDLELEPAKYKISVSTKGVRSKSQYVTIKNEGGGVLGILILLIALGVGGYFGYTYFINQKRNQDATKKGWEHEKEPDSTQTQDKNEYDDDWN